MFRIGGLVECFHFWKYVKLPFMKWHPNNIPVYMNITDTNFVAGTLVYSFIYSFIHSFFLSSILSFIYAFVVRPFVL